MDKREITKPSNEIPKPDILEVNRLIRGFEEVEKMSESMRHGTVHPSKLLLQHLLRSQKNPEDYKGVDFTKVRSHLEYGCFTCASHNFEE